MKIFSQTIFLFVNAVLASNHFDNLNRAYFKYRDFSIQASEENCSFCQNPEIWKHISQIYDNAEDDEESKEYYLALSKKEPCDGIYTCKNCMYKIKLFKQIESSMSESSLISIGIENLNYVDCKEDKDDCYLVLNNDNKKYIVVINHNSVDNIENIIFLLSLSNAKNEQNHQININGPLIRFLDLNFNEKSNMEYIDRNHFSRESMMNVKKIQIEPKLLEELQKGKSIFTVKNIAVAISIYYTVGCILVLGYYSFKKEKAAF